MLARAFLVLAVITCFAGVSAAEPAPRPIILMLVVNEVQHGDAIVILDDGDALVAADDLRGAGVTVAAAAFETIHGRPYVSLRSLGIRFVSDLADMVIRLTVAPDLLETTRIDLGREEPPPITVDDDLRSLYVNYSVHAAHTTLGTSLDGYGEAGLRMAGALAQSTVIVDEPHGAVRGLSSVTWDDRDDLRRFILGDQLVAGASLGASLLVGGLHLRRSFELDPYLVTTPAFGLRGDVLVPSTAEIYVNGALVKRVQLPPGTFDLTNLPITVGASNATVVVRDALGREQQFGRQFYLPAGLLRPGLSDYHVAVGAAREDFGVASFAYGGPVGLARYRRGLTRTLTGGIAAEASRTRGAVGVTMTTTSPIGQLEIAVGAGSDRERVGAATSLAWALARRRGGIHAFAAWSSPHYATVDELGDAYRPRLEARLGTTLALARRLNVGANVEAANRSAMGWSTRASATTSIAGPRGVTLSGTFGRSQTAMMPPTLDAFVTLSVGLSPRTRGWASHDQQASRANSRLELQRTLPDGPGVGYRMALQQGERDQGSVSLQAQTSFGRYEAFHDEGDLGRRSDTTVAGGLVIVGGRVRATRPVERGFVLVRVPGASGVRTYHENKVVGRTDEDGELLVMNALPYHVNRIAIDPADLPDDRAASRTSASVAPPERGGAVAVFPAPRLEILRGQLRVRLADRWVAPSYGELTVGRASDMDDPEAERRWSPIGSDGEFEIDALSSGRHAAVIDWEDGRCELDFEVPAATAPIVDLGVIRCEPSKEERVP